MTQKNVIATNRLIAEFMGCECNSVFDFKFKGKWYGVNQLKFDSSMDWLLPVIEKIEAIPDQNTKSKTRYRVEIYNNTCEIITDADSFSNEKNGYFYHTVSKADSKTAACFYAVKSFIEFYTTAYKPTPVRKQKPAPKFYAKLDEPFKSFHKMLEKYEHKMGWKGMFYAMLKYQRIVHKDDGYNLGDSGK